MEGYVLMMVVVDNFMEEEKQKCSFPHLYVHASMPGSISQYTKILNLLYI